MKTSKEWWEEVKNDEAKLVDWLQRQYRGEVTAAKRIRALLDQYEITTYARKVLRVIAVQEEKHAEWVMRLLTARGIAIVDIDKAEERYWAEVKHAMEDFATTCAVGAHAEAMRLERIRVIADDPETPSDIKNIFYLILQEEVWHERWFAELAGPDAIARTKGQHEKGLTLLGLIA